MAKQWSFKNKAHRSFWSVHVEAWRQSGVSQSEYCGQHRLSTQTFRRWRIALGVSLSRGERPKIRKASPAPPSRSARTKALVAFWSMHVEALQWSGLSAREYASVHSLSLANLRFWRRRLDLDPPSIDWREMLHPSARPVAKLEDELSPRTKFSATESRLTTALPVGDGRSERRLFTDEDKRRLVTETLQPGVTVSAVARRHKIATSVLFRWRVELGVGQGAGTQLAEVRVQERRRRGRPRKESAALVLHDLLPRPEGSIVVELGDGRRVFATAGSDPEAVRRYVGEREAGP